MTLKRMLTVQSVRIDAWSYLLWVLVSSLLWLVRWVWTSSIHVKVLQHLNRKIKVAVLMWFHL